MRRRLFTILRFGLALVFSAARAVSLQPSQEPESRPRPRGEVDQKMERVFGTLSSVGVDRFAVKKPDGVTQIVMVNDQTRYRQGHEEMQLEDLKPGDRVMAAGRTENKEFVARMVRRVTDEEMLRFRGVIGGMVFGEIVSIDKNQLKVRTPQQSGQVVVVDDKTRFMKEGQAISPKDLKVGDRIAAMGKESNGQFAATQIRTGRMQFQRDAGQENPPRKVAHESH